MIKKRILLALLPIASTFFVACDNKEKPKNSKNSVPTASVHKSTEEGNKTIAYVEVDSLLTQYAFCIKEKAALEARAKQYEQQVKNKGTQVEKAMMAFQQKLQQGTFTSQEQAQGEQRKIQAMQEQAVKMQQNLAEKIAKEQERFNKTLRDSVQSYLKDYNKTAKYDIILSKQGDNVLYANESLDITTEVINGMNKRYKK